MKSKSIGILTKPKFPEVKATVHAVVTWLRGRKIDVILDNTSATLLNERGGVQKTQLAAKADVLSSWAVTARCSMRRGWPVNEAFRFSASIWAGSVF